jgi:hypothetical protein
VVLRLFGADVSLCRACGGGVLKRVGGQDVILSSPVCGRIRVGDVEWDYDHARTAQNFIECGREQAS